MWWRQRLVGFFFSALITLSTTASLGQDAYLRGMTVAGDIGFGHLGSAPLTTFNLGLDLREGQLAMGLFGRIRLVMAESDDVRGTVRDRDWDEAGDFIHILRHLQFRHHVTGGSIAVQAGEMLSYTLGHGTLVREYSNIANPDHLNSGLRFDLTSRYVDVAAALDNFVQPHLVALRAGVRPFSNLDRLAFGVSMAIDPTAPRTIRQDAAGERAVDNAWNLQTDHEALTLFGLDVEYRFGNRNHAEVTPYADLNTSIHGVGFHAGSHGVFALGRSGAHLTAQLEYHASSGGYVPAQMQTFYDLERYQASLSFSDVADASQAASEPMLAGIKRGVYDGHGMLAGLGVDWGRLAAFKIGFSMRPGPDGRLLWFRGMAEPIPRLNLGFLLMIRDLGGSHPGAGGIGAAAEVRFRFNDYLYALGQYSRSWLLREESRYFGAIQNLNVGIGGSWNG